MFGLIYLAQPITTLCPRCGEYFVTSDESRHRYFCKTKGEREDAAVEHGRNLMRQGYFDDVRSCAENIKSEIASEIKDGKRGEELREWLIDNLDQTCDGHQRVIYTYQAQETLLFSENDGAIEEMGSAEGFVTSDGVEWSKLAYFAFRADVVRHLAALDVDVDEPDAGTDDESEDA